MGRLAGLAALVVCVSACGASATTASVSPSPVVASPSDSPTTPSAGPSPSPVPQVVCHGGGGAGSMVLIGGVYAPSLLYDVSDPVHPRLLCNISNTSAHLFTGDTFEYLKPVSANETDVILHSLGSGNESVAGKFPFYATSGSWLPDLTVMAYTIPVSVDNTPAGGMQVWLYSQRRNALLYTYRVGIGDCICRFGLPPQVLAISPDGQYLVAGWLAGKGSEPHAVYRVSDRSRVATLDSVGTAFWGRVGHRLFLGRLGTDPEESWTPEAGISTLNGAGNWSFLPGVSPDDGQVAYTAQADTTQLNLRIYVYDVNASTTRMLVDGLRSQALFVKDGWVWYLEERACGPADGCPGATMPAGKVYAMNLSAGVEREVSFGSGADPLSQAGTWARGVFAPGEFWPAT